MKVDWPLVAALLLYELGCLATGYLVAQLAG